MSDRPQALLRTDLPLPERREGKVRDVYRFAAAGAAPGDAGETDRVLIVATDRISAFDAVMQNGIPGRGVILTEISRFWFDWMSDRLGERFRHHLLSADPADVPGLSDDQRRRIARRVMIGRRCDVVPVECVVRGYLAGSGFAEYRRRGSVCGVELPPGLREADRLPEPIFTPTTKAETGHDEPVSFEQAAERVGPRLMARLRELSLEIYRLAAEHAADRGLIIADTKFEFGLPPDRREGEIEPVLVDELLTPDSSRFWPADDYEPGRPQASFDKQFIRDYLQSEVDAGRWDKTPPGPALPERIIDRSLEKYREAYRMITGAGIDPLT